MKPVEPLETKETAVPSLMESAEALGKLGEESGETKKETEEQGEEAQATEGTEAEAAEAGEEAGEEAEEAEGEGEEAESEGPVKFTPAQQKVFDKRLGKEVAKRKTLEDKVKALEADLESAKNTQDAGTIDAARSLQVMPEYLKPGEVEVLKRDEQMLAFEDWAADNADGYDDGKVSYTAAQIRKRLVEVQREHARIARRADEIRERAAREQKEDLLAGRKARMARAAAEAELKKRQPAKAAAPMEAKPAAAAKSGKPSPDQIFEKKGMNKQAAAEALNMM